MVRFSVAEGKAEKRRKLLYASSSSSWNAPDVEEQEDGDDNNEAEEDEEEAAACAGAGGVPDPLCAVGSESSNGAKEAVTVTIDADVLDCPICCETLAPPIFQCENGHIACASCCTKMEKCHSCSCPIGPIRCLALENVIESIKVSCPYASNGCGEIVCYAQRRTHRETCVYLPCFCPIVGCTFSGSVWQLSHHFSGRHGDRAIFFLYNVPFEVSFSINEPFNVLLGEDGILFLILNNSSVPLGNAITVSCIGPDSLKGDFSYRLVARSKESSIQFESCMTNMKRWNGVSSSKDFLLIPQGFCVVPGELNLNVCVMNKVP